MYETLINPNESALEKLLLHEFMEVCCYHNCYKDEIDEKIKLIWEEFLAMEIEHLKIAAKLFEKYENRDPIEIIGDKVYDTCHFESQKEYVNKILTTEISKRLDGKKDKGFCNIVDLSDNWECYKLQHIVSLDGAPSENAVNLSVSSFDTDINFCESNIYKNRCKLLSDALDIKSQASNTVSVDTYSKIKKKELFI